MSPLKKAILLVSATFVSMSFAADPPKWTAELILDDFEDIYGDAINRSALGAVKSYSANNGNYNKGKFGYWYVFSGNGGIITNSSAEELTSSNISTAFDVTEKCLHVNFDAEDEESYAAIATNLFNEGDWVNLSKMTSFSFRAKGSGDIRFYFKSKFYKNEGYTWGDIGYSVTLTAAWKTYDIKVAQLLPAPYSDAETDDVTWADCKDSITSLAIEITTDEEGTKAATEAWVDDIIFKGMKYSDIVDSIVAIGISTRKGNLVNTRSAFSIANNTISYNLSQPQNASFSILDLNGAVVGNVNGKSTVGKHAVALPALTPGQYLVKMNGVNTPAQQFSIVK